LKNINHYAKAHCSQYISIYNYKIYLPVDENLGDKQSQYLERRYKKKWNFHCFESVQEERSFKNVKCSYFVDNERK